ncbi:MAG: HAMP domain-containing sensor histidine kinase [Candidatus Nanopelagicales bacterium]
MTAEARPGGRRSRRSGARGSLGGRLLLAFTVVSLVAVAVLTVSALIGSGLGLSALRTEEREAVAVTVADLAAQAYTRAGGWEGADLSDATAVASAAGAGLSVRDADGVIVGTGTDGHGQAGGGNPDGGNPASGQGSGPGPGGGAVVSAGSGAVVAPVVVEGQQVGTVRLGFGTPAAGSGRSVAWTWIAVAAVVALGVAILASWWVTRRLTRPLGELAGTARAFGAGDRTARAQEAGPDEVAEVAAAFNDAADAVALAESQRRQMAADVAHEVRTPLAVLQAGLEELRDGYVPPDPQVLAGLHDQALRLGRVVDDLARLAAAEDPTPRGPRTDVDLAALVRSAVAAHEPALAAAGLTVHTQVQDGIHVVADGDQLHQVVGNLLSNAARFCRPGDEVSVRVELGGTAADVARVVVADTGPGILPEDLPHVFDRFWRGPRADEVPGSGLGLSVVRALVEANGGTVTLDSDGETGTHATVQLPARP